MTKATFLSSDQVDCEVDQNNCDACVPWKRAQIVSSLRPGAALTSVVRKWGSQPVLSIVRMPLAALSLQYACALQPAAPTEKSHVDSTVRPCLARSRRHTGWTGSSWKARAKSASALACSPLEAYQRP